MPDWFDSIAIKDDKPKADSWFDQFSTTTSEPEKPKKPKSLWESATDTIKSTLDAHPKVKDFGERLLFGETNQDKLNTEKFGEEHGVGKLKLATEADSILPAHITGKHEPESKATGFADSLYRDFVRPATTVPGILGGMAIKGRFSNPETYNAIQRGERLGLPTNPEPVPVSYVKQGAENAKLGLPAKGESTDIPRTFYQGEAGTTEAGKSYPMDTAPASPRLGQIDQIPSPGSKGTLPVTVLPRETEGLSNLDPITAAARGTRLGDIQSLPKDDPRSTVVTLDKVRRGEPIKMPTAEPIGDIEVPNERKASDSFAPTELPDPDARPFGSTREDKNSPWDTSRESKTDKQGLVPDTPETSVNIPSTKGNKVDTANLSKQNNSTGVPTPGQAVSNSQVSDPNAPRSKDINNIRAEYGSVDKTLSSRPETAPIAEHIIGAADQKAQWIATTERQLADITSGLNKGDLVTLGDIVDKGAKLGDDLNLVDKAKAIKEILDQVHAELKIPTSITGGKIGYIQNYLTHISKLPDDDLKTGIRQIWEYHVGKPFNDIFGSAELGKAGDSIGDMYDRGLGNPDSPFRKARGVGSDVELNVNKVLPAYIESIARLKFDRPAVDMAKKVLASVPDKDIYGNPSKIKELAGWYIKNYTRYDSMPGLTQGWNDLTNKVLRTTARSMLGFSTGLQTLHLARIPMNLYPELGEKYMLAGVKAVGKKPFQAYKEATSLGLLQNEVRPWNFKTPMQKYDSISSFMAGADFLDRAIGYHGFKQMFLDQGLNEAEASAKALSKAKSSSLFIDAARPTKGFSNDAAVFGGAAGRLTTQFKQVPARIIEQYIQIAANAKNDPKKAARMIGGAGLAIAGVEAGLHTFHISPQQFLFQMAGATGQQAVSVGREFLPLMKGVTQSLANGDVVGALKATQDWATSDHPKNAAIKTGLWLTPGGNSAVRQWNKGLSMFEKD